MLERYYFLADVLALALALSLQTRRAALIAIGVQGASLLSLLTYIYWYHWPYPALAGPPLGGVPPKRWRPAFDGVSSLDVPLRLTERE